MKRIVLFDTIIDGHHADYLTHLINFWLHQRPEGELLVVTQASFESTFQQLVDVAPTGAAVRFIPIPQSEIEQTHRASMLARAFKEWNLLRRYVHEYQPSHVLLMYFDIFQMGLWLGRKVPCKVSGIYFRPDFHYKTVHGVKARLNVVRKKLTLRGMLRRNVLTNLFCLDHSVVATLQAIEPGVNVVPLPDPVKAYSIPSIEIDKLRSELKIKPERQVFLLFGYLDDRKGIEPLLEALKHLNPALHSRICVVLAGAIRSDYQQSIEQKIAAISPVVQIVCEFREVRGQRIQAFFDLADYALALYQRHVGMASVIIRAAVSGKPVLASDYGYVGKIVEQEKLGAVVDSTSPEAISQLLEKVLTEGVTYSEENLQKLAYQNSDVCFAETIFDVL
ncbi:glycosyltransferase family 4 protein [Spirosoma sp. BT702]|uniref:Glycosyltransferase family 4 protein n=1 Tax=Spirosoma profusum TaxID=2771354 RepID=A0A927ASM9_9BACT|nr:glycosyltransferase [Spirosoma profusum]MBD2704141.1 glycosyltransferase family 4 protein [Spirosoma profusum]